MHVCFLWTFTICWFIYKKLPRDQRPFLCISFLCDLPPYVVPHILNLEYKPSDLLRRTKVGFPLKGRKRTTFAVKRLRFEAEFPFIFQKLGKLPTFSERQFFHLGNGWHLPHLLTVLCRDQDNRHGSTLWIVKGWAKMSLFCVCVWCVNRCREGIIFSSQEQRNALRHVRSPTMVPVRKLETKWTEAGRWPLGHSVFLQAPGMGAVCPRLPLLRDWRSPSLFLPRPLAH